MVLKPKRAPRDVGVRDEAGRGRRSACRRWPGDRDLDRVYASLYGHGRGIVFPSVLLPRPSAYEGTLASFARPTPFFIFMFFWVRGPAESGGDLRVTGVTDTAARPR